MLSCKAHILFFSSHLEMCIKLLHDDVYSWDLDQLSMTGIGMQRLYLLVICWLICLREETIAYATAQIVEVFHQSFMYPTTWSISIIWTMSTQNLSTLQAFFQHFPSQAEISFEKFVQKNLSDFSASAFLTCCKETCQK